MTRELLLLRHGKSDWTAAVDDYQRPLKGRGKRGARRIGAWLAEEGFMPDYIVTSPAERAWRTAQKACKAMGKGDGEINRDRRLYAAGLDELFAVLADCPAGADRVMFVGHNPGLEDLLVWLAGEAVAMPDDGKLLPTATLARLQMPADWHGLQRNCARLKSITRAQDIGML